MDFSSFLKAASKPNFWQQTSNICFVGNEYPSAWFGLLFSYAQANNLLTIPYQRIFVSDIEKKVLYSSLSQSILGNYSFFWLGDASDEVDGKQGKQLFDYLLSYKGPHRIAYFINSASQTKTDCCLIQIPQEIPVASCMEVAMFLYPNLDKNKQMMARTLAGSQQKSMSLDEFCMLLGYIDLIDSQNIHEYKDFLTGLIGQPPALQALTECFFSKNPQRFFTLWRAVCKDYPDMFWLSFWADNVWRAYHVTQFLNQKNFPQAKRMSYRLPFSFINRDWQKCKAEELVEAYKFLYHLDFAYKTGSTFCYFDLFFLNYFMGNFVGRKAS